MRLPHKKFNRCVIKLSTGTRLVSLFQICEPTTTNNIRTTIASWTPHHSHFLRPNIPLPDGASSVRNASRNG